MKNCIDFDVKSSNMGVLKDYLAEHAPHMHRTTLRYATEKIR